MGTVPKPILVTGALGQIGTELVEALQDKYGKESVIPTDVREANGCTQLDVMDAEGIENLVRSKGITDIYHLAALLSATGEKNPDLCWSVNVDGLVNVISAAKKYGCRVFSPSSIAVFGPDCPKHAPQVTGLNPTTVYGKTKVVGEHLAMSSGIDMRGLRYPGLISWKAPAGGGTTDYAVEIFHAALSEGHYNCFVREDTRLPMMYMDDAIRATLELMDTPFDSLGTSRGGYNIAGCSFTAGELVNSIQRHIPEFTCSFEPDVRQNYADSWPDSIEDDVARKEWGWISKFDLDKIVDDMIDNLQ
ncbi:MAG: NAD-dependent epimerase/dehydratase family protein [Candidatus Thermoplasmatota archaeon]|nr:NAD-dependent epimerase/dehydratase family protein [Candidatus Thermoplasmatota archaeon]